MACPVCGAHAEQFMSTISGVIVVCPMCGEYEIASSVLATEQWRRLEPEERGDALNKAKASTHPGARPTITPDLIAPDIEFADHLSGTRV